MFWMVLSSRTGCSALLHLSHSNLVARCPFEMWTWKCFITALTSCLLHGLFTFLRGLNSGKHNKEFFQTVRTTTEISNDKIFIDGVRYQRSVFSVTYSNCQHLQMVEHVNESLHKHLHSSNVLFCLYYWAQVLGHYHMTTVYCNTLFM